MSTQSQWKESAVSPSSMELPRKMNGDVDWKTLGNILVAHLLGEVLRASYVDSKYGKQQEGLVPATSWKYAYEEKDVVVLVKELENSSLKCFMGRSVIDLSPKVIHDFISVNENVLHWDKYAVESRLVDCLREEEDIQDGIGYMRHEARQCLVKSKRDFLFYVRNQHMPDTGKRVMSALSVDYASCPPVPGVQRAQICLGTGWVLEPYRGDPSKTLVSYLAHLNLGTGLPPLIVNRVMRRQPLNVHYLHRHLTRPKETSLKKSLKVNEKSTSKTENVPPDLLVTPTSEIPTPDAFHDQTGYTFSAVPLGSNPLYNNNWSLGSTIASKCKETAKSPKDSDDDGGGQNNRENFEESECAIDFRAISIDGVENGANSLHLPLFKNLQTLPQQSHEGTDESHPSSESDSSSKGRSTCSVTAMSTRE